MRFLCGSLKGDFLMETAMSMTMETQSETTSRNGSAEAAKRSRPTFQIGRQMEIYRAGKRTDTGQIPLAVEELEAKARGILSEEAYDWIAGTAGRGDTGRNNLSAFERYQIVPRMLCDISQRDFGLELFGQRLPHPFLVAPIGVQAAAHVEGEKASAAAAASLGVPFVLSNVASFSMEAVAQAAGPGPRWFQLYWPNDAELTQSLVRRAESAGYSAIVLTLDTQILGWRERNLQLAFLPFLRGQGLANYFTDPVFRKGLAKPPEEDLNAAVDHYLQVFSDLRRTWKDLRLLREITRLPLLVKGIQHADDAREALDQGVDGIVVSNHGGRQVDGAVATLDVLPTIVDAVQGRVPVLFDGGIRRGADVFKALALGARAVLVGRPILWALSVGGRNGVVEYLRNLAADIDLTFALSGKRTLTDVWRDDLLGTSSLRQGVA
jgi:isopentenyl diphosphate isomerase/L-lactate dehydrogenase-like FMN-dependent dehydrogenase